MIQTNKEICKMRMGRRMKKKEKTVPIFFTVDNGYIPFLATTLQSLTDNSSKDYYYIIRILYSDINEKNKQLIKKYESDNVEIEFVDLNEYVEYIEDKLYTRDYYSKTTYFRLFIPELYPDLNKALYIDSDTIVLGNIADLYNIDIGDNLLGAVADNSVQIVPEFKDYVEKVIGVASYKNYFNAGVLVMNLEELRKFKFQEKFMYLLETIKFKVAQDQDYLNRICKGRVKIIDYIWNRMPFENSDVEDNDIKLLHFNLLFKPWHFDDILFQEYFWDYAKKTDFYDEIRKIKEDYTDEDRKRDKEKQTKLIELSLKEANCVGDDRRYRKLKSLLKREQTTEKIEKDPSKIEMLKEIERLEREGIFDKDVADDPPTVTLMPDGVDYLRVKSSSKLKSKLANTIGESFLRELLRSNKLIIKEIRGIEHLNNLESGAMLTCNHFNPFDVFAIEKVFRDSKLYKKKKLYKVIREGNYTNFPGLYGFFFRNCDTLPLSSNTKTMVEFMKAVDTIFKKKDLILIYPEQSLWWNYKKPKPLKDGAYKLAVRNNVPVIPIFITMKESNIIGDDGFPIMEYFIHIKEPIYENDKLTSKENIKFMKEKNFEIWKNIYEDFYNIPLKYTTVEEGSNKDDDKETSYNENEIKEI